MTYKEIEIEFRGELQKHIVIEHDDGSLTTFPANEDNPHYQAYLKMLDAGELTIAPAEGE
jgi:hypothetical protein